MTDTADSVGIGVLGGGAFIANAAVLPAIRAARGVHLSAIASRSGGIADAWADRAVADYDDVLADPDTDAVYLALPNGLHRAWAERAAEHGLAVLCEKPLAPSADDAEAMAAACDRHGVLLAEAWMTPFGTSWRRLIACLDPTQIREIDARFTFRIGPDQDRNYRWDPTQGGGALLDVGIYTTGLAVELFGPDLEIVEATGGTRTADDLDLTGPAVDAWTRATLRTATGATIRIWCSFVDDEAQTLRVTDHSGRSIELTGTAFTQQAGAPGEADPYQDMIEAFGDAVAGRAPWPRTAARAVAHLGLLDRIARRRDRRPA